jgi:Uma2 family endonuclease
MLAMTLQVFDSERGIVADEFLVRIPGWTWERYLAEAPETQICEYEHGDLIVHSPAKRPHQEQVGFLTYLLRGLCSRRGLGRVYNGPSVLRLSADVAREPDIFVVSSADTPRVLQQEDYVDTVPVLIVEVVSRSTRTLDLVTKAQEYASLGVPEYWAVDRERNLVVVHRLRTGRYDVTTLGSGRLDAASMPGFWILVEWLWQDPPPPDHDCLERIQRG